MSLDATALRKLAALNLNSDQMAGVLEVLASMTEKDDERKAAQRERTRKFRQKIGVTLPSPHGNSDTSRGSDARGEDITSSQKIEPQESKNRTAKASGLAEFRSDLSPDLDTDLLEAFVAVRKAKRGALSGFAARLFRGDAEKCGMSLVEAATECVRSSWITVKPEYFAGRPQQRAGPSRNKTLDAARNLMDQFDAVTPSEIEGHHPPPRLVAIGSR